MFQGQMNQMHPSLKSSIIDIYAGLDVTGDHGFFGGSTETKNHTTSLLESEIFSFAQTAQIARSPLPGLLDTFFYVYRLMKFCRK